MLLPQPSIPSKEINIPIIGLVENMSSLLIDGKKHYIFGKDGAKNLASDLNVSYLGGLPLIQTIREASDVGHPTALQKKSKISDVIQTITRNMISELVKRNKNLPASEALKITTMAGCSAVKK